MRYLSICSGIDAATVAWKPMDWEPAAYSEIENFPRAVLKHHYPDVPLHGDFTTIKGDEYGSIDLLVGGTPCQSFSTAGLQGGLDDSRGVLALEYSKLADRCSARWFIWENVPGVLSSNGGRDFASIVWAMVKIGFGVCWRVLDARYFNLAAPRKRVLVVGYRGDWRRAGAVLFERETMRRDTSSGRDSSVEGARTLTAATPFGRGDAAPLIPCWWDGGQVAQVADAVLYKGQTMPDKSRFPALIDRANRLRFATPREWERMLGFPDDYTLIPYRGKPAEQCPDGPRYKALGNSMAVPVMRWIGERIKMAEDL